MPRGHGQAPARAWDFSAKVLLAEPLGSETLLIIQLGTDEVVAKMLNPVPVKPDQAMDFQLDRAAMHLFDAARQTSLAA